jgi:hypothetical protein
MEKNQMENYFLGWGTLVLINTALANIDGRSPLAYFVGSLFFGPILTLVLGVTKYDPEKGTSFVSLSLGRSGVAAPVTRLPNWLIVTAIIGFGVLFWAILTGK